MKASLCLEGSFHGYLDPRNRANIWRKISHVLHDFIDLVGTFLYWYVAFGHCYIVTSNCSPAYRSSQSRRHQLTQMLGSSEFSIYGGVWFKWFNLVLLCICSAPSDYNFFCYELIIAPPYIQTKALIIWWWWWRINRHQWCTQHTKSCHTKMNISGGITKFS